MHRPIFIRVSHSCAAPGPVNYARSVHISTNSPVNYCDWQTKSGSNRLSRRTGRRRGYLEPELLWRKAVRFDPDHVVTDEESHASKSMPMTPLGNIAYFAGNTGDRGHQPRAVQQCAVDGRQPSTPEDIDLCLQAVTLDNYGAGC